MELPQEYWHDCTLLEIAGVIGTPLVIDMLHKKEFLVIMLVF